MLVDAVAERESAADGDSEDFREAAEAGVVAFAVFGRGRFVVWGGGVVVVARAGGLREGAFRDCFCGRASC